MAKDKKKKKDKKKNAPAGSTAAKGLKSLAQNPLVAEVVAAALVATAAALKNPKKARQLADQAGDELNALAKDSTDRGSAMWQLALDVGRRALDNFSVDGAKPAKRAKASTPKAVKQVKAAKKPKRKSTGAKPN